MNNKFDGYVIYTDMDGTLLNDDKEISRENINAINYFIDNGGRFSIATGRAIQAIEKYFKYFKINLPAIVYNGGMIATTKKTIYENAVEDYKKELIVRIAKEYSEIGIEIYSNSDIFVYKDNNMSERPATKLLNLQYNIPEDLFSRKWNKILLVGQTDYINNILEEFEEKYNVKLVKSGPFYLEILPENTSKGSGLEKIIDIYDLDKSKVIAVGDDMNDLEMLESCGIPFCPSNGAEKLKKVSKYIIEDNNNNVILHIINTLEDIIK